MRIKKTILKVVLGFVGLALFLIVIILAVQFVIPEWRHNSSLRKVIDTTDRIVIQTITTYKYDSENGLYAAQNPKIIGEITKPEEAREFVNHIRVYPNKILGGWWHACDGDYDFVFWKGDKVLTTVNIGHGTTLRWKGWNTGDHRATPECIKYLEGLFQKMGAKLIQE